MAAISATDLSNALKRLYGPEKLTNLVFDNKSRTAFNWVPKNEGFAGSVLDVPVLFEDAAGGRSATFSNAQTNSSAVEVGRFAVDVVQNHQIVQITTDALLRGRTDKGTFLRNTVLRVDTALNNLANDLETGLFRDGSGAIGTTSAQTATTLTLADAHDARNFYVGQELVAAANTSSALRSTSTTVTAVNFITGVLTVDTDITTPWTVGDTLFTQGDYTAASDRLKLTGFDGWLQGSTTLFGQDRSTHSRLQGIAGTGGLSDIKKAIYDNAALAMQYSGAMPDTAILGWETFSGLVDQLDVDVRRSAETDGKAVAGFSDISIIGPAGPMKVMGATKCPDDVVYILQRDTWTLYSMGPAVRINNDDGLMASRLSASSGLEVRADSHAQLACRSPAKNVRVALS